MDDPAVREIPETGLDLAGGLRITRIPTHDDKPNPIRTEVGIPSDGRFKAVVVVPRKERPGQEDDELSATVKWRPIGPFRWIRGRSHPCHVNQRVLAAEVPGR